jgi:hypothetical protein
MPGDPRALLIVALLGTLAFLVFTGINRLLRFLRAPGLLSVAYLIPLIAITVAVSIQSDVPQVRRFGWLTVGVAAFLRLTLDLMGRQRRNETQ